MVIFSAIAMAVTYLLIRIQGSLPLNPQHFGAVSPALSFNTAASFMTNTNWQNYGGETTMSYFSQIGALTLEQMLSPVIGIAVAIALVRGFSRRNSPTIGNFWVDMTRGLFYIVIPIAFVAGIIFVGQGAVQTLAGTVSFHNLLNGVSQTIARGPIGFMEAIKQLGNNGGGFLNANSATTFENPTGLTNWLSIYLLLAIPFALTYTFGKMVGSVRQGAALLAAMVIIFGVVGDASPLSPSTGRTRPSQAAGVHSTVGNTVGKEVRFGDTTTALFGVSSTSTSTGSADASYDSFTPIGGGGLLTGMMLGEVTPGGAGSGLYTILIYAIIAVFIGGLMIGRTPEYLGKKIQAKEVKLAGLGALVMPLIVLVFTAIAVSIHAGRAGPLNAGPHGFSEILYALTSQGNNNGSAFGGLTGDTTFYNVIGGIDMLLGRVRHHDPGPRPRGRAGGQERGTRVARHLPHRQHHVRRPHHRCHRHHRWPHLLPCRLARSDCRATQPRKVLLMTMTTTPPAQPEPGSAPHGVAEARGLFDGPILRQALVDSLKKLNPATQIRNPVMFVVLVGSVITFIEAIAHPGKFTWSITIWLFLTVIFANFAEAHGGGPGQGAGRHAAQDALGDRGAAPERGRDRDAGAGGRVGQGRPGRLRGQRPDSLRRGDRRRHRLGRRVGHHRRVGPGHPRVGRGPLGGHRRHAGSLRPHCGAHHRRAGSHVLGSNDHPGRRGQPAENTQ